MGKQAVDVFVVHDGAHRDPKSGFLRVILEQAHSVSVFVDDHSLAVGSQDREKMPEELAAAAVVVVVLSPEFVRKEHPMAMLHAALAQQGCPSGPRMQRICPICYSLSVEECTRSDFREQYDLQPWDSLGLTEQKPEPEVLDGYAKDIQELCSITGLHQDQAWAYQGILATSAVEAVIRCLQVVGRLPEGYSLGMPRCFVPSNPCSLIGRAKEEQQVLDGLQKNRCVIISGGPGEGKSALAQKVVWDMWERGELPGGAYPVNLAGVSQSAMEDSSAAMPSEWMSQALANVLLRSISMDDAKAHLNQKGGWEAVEQCLHTRDARGKSMLLLLENAKDAQGTPQAVQELARALKRLSDFRHVLVLVTSRALIACKHAAHIGIGKMDTAPAVKLLRARCMTSAQPWEPDLAQQLAELCGRNALSLTILGSFIKSGRCTMEKAVSAGGVLRIEEGARAGGVRDDEHIVRVRAWLLTYLSPEEQQALCRLWMFKGGFQLEAAQAMLGSSTSRAVQGILRDLRDTSCLQLSTPPATESSAVRYSMHALVGEIFRDEFAALGGPVQSSILQDFVRLMAARVDMLLALLVPGLFLEATKLLADDLLNFRELRYMLRSNSQFSILLSAAGIRRLIVLGEAMGYLGQHAEATGLLFETTQQASRSLGDLHADTLRSMDTLALAFSHMGQHAAAKAVHKEALPLMEETLGGEHPDTLLCRMHSALVLEEAGELEAAAEQQAQALQGMQRVHGKRDPTTLASMSNLGSCLGKLGRHSEALKLQEEAVELTCDALGLRHPNTITCMHNLAAGLVAVGEHGRAAQQQEQVMQLYLEVLGEKHPLALQSLHNWASILDNRGEHARAAVLFREAAVLRQGVLGKRHPETLASMHAAACALGRAGRHAEAAQQHEVTLQLRQEVLGPSHPDVASSMNELGVALGHGGQHAAAVEWFERALHMRQRVLDPDHPDWLKTRVNLGSALIDTGDYSAAAEHLAETLAIQLRVLGAEHNDVMASMCALADVLGRVGDHAAAAQLHEQALQLFEKLRGAKHPDTLTFVHELGCELQAAGKYSAAVQHHARALRGRQEVLELGDIDTRRSMHALALALQSSGEDAGAARQMEEMLQLQLRVLGPEHVETLANMRNLGTTLLALGKFDAAVQHLKVAAEETLLRLQGPDSPYTLDALQQLARALKYCAYERGATLVVQQAAQPGQRAPGPEHADTLDRMASALEVDGQHAAATQLREQALKLRRSAPSTGPREPRPPTQACQARLQAFGRTAVVVRGEVGAGQRKSTGSHLRHSSQQRMHPRLALGIRPLIKGC